MTFHMWRLSEVGEDNLGLAFSADGLVLGRTALVERRDQQFVVRERHEIERLFRRGYETDPPVERIMSGLATVARALNADDQCLARIAAVHLRIPDLPDALARADMDAEDRLIRYARDEGGEVDWDPAKHPRTGTPPNPGWFAPTDGDDEPPPTRTAANVDPTRRSDATSRIDGDSWVSLPPGPKRIDELADFVEWLANATPQDEQAIRADIDRYFKQAGWESAANDLNRKLSIVLRPDTTKDDRQKIVDHLDDYTRVDPGEYIGTFQFVAATAIGVGRVPPAAAGEVVTDGAVAESEATEGATAEATADARSEVWTYGWAKRGQEIHKQLSDGSLGPNFPTIDMIPNGAATSIKSIDLNATTYQDAARLTQRINRYIGDLAEFDGATWGTDVVKPSDIQSRTLQLVVPKGSITAAQRGAITAAQERARSMNLTPIKLIVTEL